MTSPCPQTAPRRPGLLRSPLFWALILAALLIRLWNLGGKSLWLDEALTLDFALNPIPQIITDTGKANPPLYFVLQHYWIAALGSSEAALRFPSAVFGTLAVALTAWLGLLLSGRRLAFTAMLLMAVSPAAVTYSQMARGYALFLALSLASYGSLLAWERTGRRRWSLLYVPVTAAMCYTHNYCLFNLLAQHLYVGSRTLRRRRLLLPWAAMSLAVLALYLPWLRVVAHQSAAVREHGFWIARSGFPILWGTVLDYVAAPGAPWWVLCPYLLLAVIGVSRASGIPPSSRGLLVLWFLSPLAVPFVLSRVFVPIFVGRYSIAASAAFHVAVASGLAAARSRLARAAGIAALAAAGLVSLVLYYPRPWGDWRGIGRDLAALSKPADIILVTPGEYLKPLDYYYPGTAPLKPLWREQASLDNPRITSRLEAVSSGGGLLWLVIHERSPSSPEAMRRALEERFPALALRERRGYAGNVVLLGLDLRVSR